MKQETDEGGNLVNAVQKSAEGIVGHEHEPVLRGGETGRLTWLKA